MVLDHETYYANLTEANAKDKLEWIFEYSAKVSITVVLALQLRGVCWSVLTVCRVGWWVGWWVVWWVEQ